MFMLLYTIVIKVFNPRIMHKVKLCSCLCVDIVVKIITVKQGDIDKYTK